MKIGVFMIEPLMIVYEITVPYASCKDPREKVAWEA